MPEGLDDEEGVRPHEPGSASTARSRPAMESPDEVEVVMEDEEPDLTELMQSTGYQRHGQGPETKYLIETAILDTIAPIGGRRTPGTPPT